MTGVIKRVTTNFSLSIPVFDSPNWGQSFERNMDIIDAVLSTAGVVNNIVGPWNNNTVYGVDDRVVDMTDNSVWQCAVAHTSAVSGTFAADRASNPTYWDAVTQNVVVRGAFVHGADYFVGDFVYDTNEVLGGIVLSPFTGNTNLRNNIANIGVIYDLKADLDQWPTSTTALGYLRRNAGNTAYETRTPDEAANDLGLPLNANVTALAYLRRNAGDTAYEARTPAETRADLDLDFYEDDLGLDEEQQGQARANIGADLLGGFRNKLINGNFDFWQRATSQTTDGYGSNDRWYNNHSGSSKTNSRQSFTAGQTDVPGNPAYFSRTVVTSVSGASNVVRAYQGIEDVRTLAGKKATLTFYAKADAAKNLAISFDQSFGSGGSSPVTGIEAQKVALTTSWQKFSLVVDIPSVAGKTIGANSALWVDFWFDAGSNFDARTDSLGHQSGTFDIARVSLVEGDATLEDDPFSPRHIQQELALCQRYYQRVSASGYPGGTWTNAQKVVGGTYIVTPRRTPTFTYESGNLNSYATDEGSLAGWSAGYQGAALTASSPCTVVLGVDAEL